MKRLIITYFFWSCLLSGVAYAATAAPATATPRKIKKEVAVTLNKSPKAIFLIKRAKMDADIGEPVLYPAERQMKNLYYDVNLGSLGND